MTGTNLFPPTPMSSATMRGYCRRRRTSSPFTASWTPPGGQFSSPARSARSTRLRRKAPILSGDRGRHESHSRPVVDGQRLQQCRPGWHSRFLHEPQRSRLRPGHALHRAGCGQAGLLRHNYGLPDQNVQNANDAMSQNALTRGATVAMEFDPNAANNANVQFYVYNGGDGASTRLEFADLDGLGPKPVPHLCMVCHGGDYVGNRVRFARFREFDLPSFRYSGGAEGISRTGRTSRRARRHRLRDAQPHGPRRPCRARHPDR